MKYEHFHFSVLSLSRFSTFRCFVILCLPPDRFFVLCYPLGSHLDPRGSNVVPVAPMCPLWALIWSLLAPFGSPLVLSFGSFWFPLGSLWHPFGPLGFFCPLASFWFPLASYWLSFGSLCLLAPSAFPLALFWLRLAPFWSSLASLALMWPS